MSSFPMGRGWSGFVQKIISQSPVLITTCSACSHCFCSGCKGWDFWVALKSLSRTPISEENQWMEKEWKASSGLWSSFSEKSLRTCSLGLIILSKITEWSFLKTLYWNRSFYWVEEQKIYLITSVLAVFMYQQRPHK